MGSWVPPCRPPGVDCCDSWGSIRQELPAGSRQVPQPQCEVASDMYRGPPPPLLPAGRKSNPANPVVAKISAIETTAAITIPATHIPRRFRGCRRPRVYLVG